MMRSHAKFTLIRTFASRHFAKMIIYQSHDYIYEIIGSLTPETMGIDTGIVLKSTLEPGISVK